MAKERPAPSMPSSTDAEKTILGAIMLDNKAFYEAAESLGPEDFFLEAHQRIFACMAASAEDQQEIDLITITNRLEKRGEVNAVGGVAYVSSLIDGVPHQPSLASYVKILREKSILRRAIRLGLSIQAQAGEHFANAADVVAKANEGALGLTMESRQRTAEPLSAIIPRMHKELVERQSVSEDRPIGLRTGLKKLDASLKGYHLGEYVIISGATGDGKCFAKGTRVLMYDGSIKAIQNIRTGDVVMGPDSLPRIVTGIGRGVDTMHKVTPTKGQAYTVNSAHILTLRHTQTGEVKDVPLVEYYAWNKTKKHVWKGFRTGVEFRFSPVPVDPYYLGLWLGDGTTEKVCEITCADKETTAWLERYAHSLGLVLRQHNSYGCPRLNITSGKVAAGKQVNWLLTQMRSLNFDVIGKHIPARYLRNSREVRRKLLAGLIDSDGSWNPHSKQYDIIQKNREMADQIVFLARSLGLAAYLSPCVKTDQHGTSGDYYRMQITGDLTPIPVLIDRKKASSRTINKNPMNVGIRVEPCGVDEYFGIALAGTDGRFLLADFTVVHNTSLALQAIIANMFDSVPTLMFSKEMTAESIAMRLLAAVGDWSHEQLRDPRGLDMYTFQKLPALLDNMGKWPLWVDDASGLHIREVVARIRAFARRQKRVNDPRLLVVLDYLQLVTGDGDNTVERLNHVSGSVRDLTKREKLAMLALSQYSRPEGKVKRRPSLMDLKGSGQLEQDAFTVLACYRPQDEYTRYQGSDEILALKNRNGETGLAAKVKYDTKKLIFEEREDKHRDE